MNFAAVSSPRRTWLPAYFAPTLIALFTCMSVLAAFGAMPSQANAQVKRVRRLNDKAMTLYTELEVEKAFSTLQQALRMCRRKKIRGKVLAETYIRLGIVTVGGQNDIERGTSYFISAVEADGSVQVPAEFRTPDIKDAFRAAQEQVPGTVVTPTEDDPAPVEHEPMPVSDRVKIAHDRVTEQLTNTPLPIFTSVEGMQNGEKVVLFYRGSGGRFVESTMAPYQDGFAYEIHCGEVSGSELSYYIVVRSDTGATVASNGSPTAPHRLRIVERRTLAAPALPGASAPSQCSPSEECPPGMECGAHDQSGGGVGTQCITSGDCRSGLSCVDSMCAMPYDAEDEAPKFFAHVGFTLGLGYLSGGKPTDREPPMSEVAGQGIYVAYERAGENDCNPNAAVSNYCVKVLSPGFVPTYAVRASIGYWLVPRIGVSANVRFQLDAGDGDMSNLQLALRVHGHITDPVESGLHSDAFLGVGYGQIQLKAPLGSGTNDTMAQPGSPGCSGSEPCPVDRPYAVSGLMAVQLGVNLGYRFTKNFGLVITPEVQVLFPEFMWGIDLTGGAAITF